MAKSKPRATRDIDSFQKPAEDKTTPAQDTAYESSIDLVVTKIQEQGVRTRAQVGEVIDHIFYDKPKLKGRIGDRNFTTFDKDVIEELDRRRRATLKALKAAAPSDEQIKEARQTNQQARYLKKMKEKGFLTVKKPGLFLERQKRQSYNKAREEYEEELFQNFKRIFLNSTSTIPDRPEKTQPLHRKAFDAATKKYKKQLERRYYDEFHVRLQATPAPPPDRPKKGQHLKIQQSAYDDAKEKYEKELYDKYVKEFKKKFINRATDVPDRPHKSELIKRKAYDAAIKKHREHLEKRYSDEFYDQFEADPDSPPDKPGILQRIRRSAYDKAVKKYEKKLYDEFRVNFNDGSKPTSDIKERPYSSDAIARRVFDSAWEYCKESLIQRFDDGYYADFMNPDPGKAKPIRPTRKEPFERKGFDAAKKRYDDERYEELCNKFKLNFNNPGGTLLSEPRIGDPVETEAYRDAEEDCKDILFKRFAKEYHGQFFDPNQANPNRSPKSKKLRRIAYDEVKKMYEKSVKEEKKQAAVSKKAADKAAAAKKATTPPKSK